MADIVIVPAELWHVQALGELMNNEDRAEAEAMGVKAHRALWRGWKNSGIRYTALVDGEPAAMWGCEGSFLGLEGRVWLVTGRRARDVSPHAFARIYRAEVRKMLEIYDVLWNYVSDDYVGAKKMLRLSGFTLAEPVPLTRCRRLFRRFYKRAS